MPESSDENDSHNDFDANARLFAEAVEALAELQEEINAISKLEAQQAETTQSLNDSNASLHAAVEALSPVGELGTGLLTALKDTIATADAVLLQSNIEAIRGDFTNLSQEVVTLRDSVQIERDRYRDERDALQKELDDLKMKLQALPKRILNKHRLP